MNECNCNGCPVKGAVCGYVTMDKGCAAPDSYDCYYKNITQINEAVKGINNILDNAKESDPEFYKELSDTFK